MSRRRTSCLRVMTLCTAFIFFHSPSWADSFCAATNKEQNRSCSVSCPTGQSTNCSNPAGSGIPSCSCSGTPDTSGLVASRFLMTHSVTGNAFIRVEPMLATIEQAAPITNTNLIDVLNTKLASLPEQHIANVCHEEHDMCMPNGKCNMQKKWLACDALRIPHPCHSRHVCTAVNDKLKVGSPLFVVKGPDVSLGQPNLDAIPTSVLTSVGTYTNCSSLQQSQTFTHSEQVTIGNTITKTKILQTGSNLGAGISGSVKLGPLTLGGNTSLQINTTTSLSEADTDNHTETKT